jgi:hypothetical protein
VKPRVALATLVVAGVGALAFQHELYPVARPGAGPRPLESSPPTWRPAATVNVSLPAVPAGIGQLRGGEGVLLVHYWAPWERHARAQARALDSLRREPDLERLRVALVCFDPFPSVARFAARQRLRLAVLLDGERRLRRALPCPSIPYTYVLDARSRIAVAQDGEVDWLDPRTREVLRALLREGAPGDPREAS